MTQEPAKFAHRINPDGTADSICSRCFATVAAVKVETELLRHEQQHICDSVLVEHYSRIKPHSAQPFAEDSLISKKRIVGEIDRRGIVDIRNMDRQSHGVNIFSITD